MKFAFIEKPKEGNIVRPLEGTWDQFCQGVDHQILPSKDLAPGWVPAEFSQPLRLKENVVSVSMFVADIDHTCTMVEIAKLESVIKDYTYLLHSTYRHSPNEYRFRVIIPFNKPVLIKDWARIWKQCAEWCPLTIDPKCKDAPHFYYLPSHPGTYPPVRYINQGRLFNPYSLIYETPHKDILDKLAKDAARRNNADAIPGHALKLASVGESFADEGDRDSVMMSVGYFLRRIYPKADPERLADYFEPSMQLMRKQDTGCPEIRERLIRIYDEKPPALFERNERIQKLFKRYNQIRIYPWTDDELEAIQKRGPWLIHFGNEYYFLTETGYTRGFNLTESKVNYLTFLAPTSIPLLTDDGKRKPFELIVQDNGTAPDNLIFDLRTDKTIYSECPSALSVGCPRRNITPYYSEYFAEFIRRAFGTNADIVNKFLAKITDLDDPCAALLTTGPKGSGKSLLADGLARIWTEQGATEMHTVLGTQFNDNLLQCPVVVADEYLPKDPITKQTMTQELRHFISTRERSVTRKHRPIAKLSGAVRVLILANNPDNVLKMRDNLSQDDIPAISERIIHVPILPGAKEYLSYLGQERVEEFVKKDEIAAHALYLNQTYKFEREGRFWIQPKNDDLFERLSVHAPVQSLVCRWCIKFLNSYLTPKDSESLFLDKKRSDWIVIQNGQMGIKHRIVNQNWKLLGEIKEPSLLETFEAVKSLSSHDERIPGLGLYRMIKTNALRLWCEIDEDSDDKGNFEILEKLKVPYQPKKANTPVTDIKDWRK